MNFLYQWGTLKGLGTYWNKFWHHQKILRDQRSKTYEQVAEADLEGAAGGASAIIFGIGGDMKHQN